MPYTKQDSRTPFKPAIMGVLDGIPIMDNIASLTRMSEKGRWFKAFVDLVFKGSTSEHPEKVEILKPFTDVIREQYRKTRHPGDLNYAISSVYWGLLGDYPRHPKADYALRVFCRGVLQSYLERMSDYYKDRMDEDFVIITYGVIGDVISETYLRKTIIFENEKMQENGDIYKDGKLV